MSIDEARKIIEELKWRFDTPFSSLDKDTIKKLYYEVIGKSFVATSCQQCYHDALIEINYHLNKYGKMADKRKYILRAGAIINCPNFMDGKVFSNDNLDDETAKEYLKMFPNQIEIFNDVAVEDETSNEDTEDETEKENKIGRKKR
ncbi:MAG: hypothetical protein MSG77_07810 [Prevotella sp.]|nr:hypothetical protein [Prevotella sp.]